MENFEKCQRCRRYFPEYLIGKYPRIHAAMCPICAKGIMNRMMRLPENTPFPDEEQELEYEEAVEFIASIKHPWGGHMINPPEECTYRFVYKDGGIWVDLALCQASCKGHCERYEQFCEMDTEERKRELLKNGVIYV